MLSVILTVITLAATAYFALIVARYVRHHQITHHASATIDNAYMLMYGHRQPFTNDLTEMKNRSGIIFNTTAATVDQLLAEGFIQSASEIGECSYPLQVCTLHYSLIYHYKARANHPQCEEASDKLSNLFVAAVESLTENIRTAKPSLRELLNIAPMFSRSDRVRENIEFSARIEKALEGVTSVDGDPVFSAFQVGSATTDILQNRPKRDNL